MLFPYLQSVSFPPLPTEVGEWREVVPARLSTTPSSLSPLLPHPSPHIIFPLPKILISGVRSFHLSPWNYNGPWEGHTFHGERDIATVRVMDTGRFGGWYTLSSGEEEDVINTPSRGAVSVLLDTPNQYRKAATPYHSYPYEFMFDADIRTHYMSTSQSEFRLEVDFHEPASIFMVRMEVPGYFSQPVCVDNPTYSLGHNEGCSNWDWYGAGTKIFEVNVLANFDACFDECKKVRCRSFVWGRNYNNKCILYQRPYKECAPGDNRWSTYRVTGYCGKQVLANAYKKDGNGNYQVIQTVSSTWRLSQWAVDGKNQFVWNQDLSHPVEADRIGIHWRWKSYMRISDLQIDYTTVGRDSWSLELDRAAEGKHVLLY